MLSARMTRSIRLLSHGESPAPPDRDEAQPDTKSPTYSGYRRGSRKNDIAKDNNRSARKGRDGVEFGGKDDRDFRDKNVTRDAAADACQHAHQQRCARS